MRREKSLVTIVVLATAFAAVLWPVRDACAQTPSAAPTQAGTRLITLGTRVGPVPVAHQAQSSNLLIVNGALYLIDAGDGTLRRLAKAGIKFNEIGVIFITHPHSDHIAGLARIIHHLLIFCGGCSAKWPIHIANRCLVELLRATAERHNRHDRRYSASL